MPLGHISEHKFIHGIKHSRFPVFFESQYISHTYMATLVCHIQLFDDTNIVEYCCWTILPSGVLQLQMYDNFWLEYYIAQ